MGHGTTRLIVNGTEHTFALDAEERLSSVLRNRLGLTGTKEACGEGACGACTVLLDGRAVLSCMLLAVEQDGKEIVTIEGLSRGGDLHPLQEAWIEEYGAQCGFCSPGMILTAMALLKRTPHPTDAEIKEALAGNLCICSNYEHIVAAVRLASRTMAGDVPHG